MSNKNSETTKCSHCKETIVYSSKFKQESSDQLCASCATCDVCGKTVDKDKEKKNALRNPLVPFCFCRYCASSICFPCGVKGANREPPIYLCCKKKILGA